MISKEFRIETELHQESFNDFVDRQAQSQIIFKSDDPSTPTNENKKKVMNLKSSSHFIQNQMSMSLTLASFSTLIQKLIKESVPRIQLPLPNFLLHTIYTEAQAKGGILEICSIGIFQSMTRSIIVENSGETQYEIDQKIIKTIRLLLFSIQFVTVHPKASKKIYELGLVNFVKKQQLRLDAKNKTVGLTYFNHDLTLFQEGAESLDIDESIFNLDFICEHYKKEHIDIRIQNPLDYGFIPNKLKNKKYKMTLGDYRFYQLNYMDAIKMKGFRHSRALVKGQVFFGVNFEPSDQMLNKQIKKNVGGTFLDFHGDFDLMSYLDIEIFGCSVPQLYFKTPGCWTGGHQQDVNMSALNINHGPGASQWYTLDLIYMQKLREQLIEKFGTDLYSAEGLWYERLDWFISRGYPVKKFIQRKDDIVVTGPGTLHWVRCLGIAMQTSWNIFPKNYDQFVAAFDRHKINKQINYWKRDVVPLKSLVKKYLNHQRTIMPNNIRLIIIKQLEEWFREQRRIVEILEKRVNKKVEFYLKDHQSFCVLCRQEVLLYFLPAPAQFEKGICCVDCYQSQQGQLCLQIEQLYSKHNISAFELLLEISKNQELNKSQPDEIKELCKGVHVGDMPIKCKVHQNIKLQTGMDSEQNKFDSTEEIQEIQRDHVSLQQTETLSTVSQKFPKDIIKTTKDHEAKVILSQNSLQLISNTKKMMSMGGKFEIFNEKTQRQTEIIMEVQSTELTEEKNQHKSRSRDKKKKKQKNKSSERFSSDSSKQLQKTSVDSSERPIRNPLSFFRNDNEDVLRNKQDKNENGDKKTSRRRLNNSGFGVDHDPSGYFSCEHNSFIQFNSNNIDECLKSQQNESYHNEHPHEH